ncbi:MAG: hypothetical protein NXH75_07400, partial [Halobacteriovoraceae bacterium]|nr:hypothetical protein [Halobacteriovoraceae bacterium]
MKFVLSFLLFLFMSSTLAVNSLECPKESGIKECQKEARGFCGESYFKIRSRKSAYIITCVGESTKGEESILVQEREQEETEEKEKTEPEDSNVVDSNTPNWRFAFGLGFNGGGSAESDLKVNDLSTGLVSTGKAKFETDSGYSLSFEGRFLRQNGWGLTMGVDIDLGREVKSGSVTLGGNTVTFSNTTNDPDEFAAVVFHGNAVYKWNNFYIPFGFNVSAVDYRATGINVNTSASLGAQLGIGYELDNGFIIELFSRALGFELDYIQSGL